MTNLEERAAEVAGSLGPRLQAVMRHARFKPEGWEPIDPFTPSMTEMVNLGLFKRANGRCGFEAFKDSFVVPTPLGLAVRQHLLSKDQGNG